jgi:glyoxylase-like metal-dependent hydrolase (beta-lactamase superfamily II)
VEEIFDNIYQLRVPLPGNPLKFLNSYLIKGSPRSLLIDTGFNLPECKDALLKGMETLGLDWSEVDFFITHAHYDHAGLVQELAGKKSTIYCSGVDAEILMAFRTSDYWNQVSLLYGNQGYPAEELEKRRKDMIDFFAEQKNDIGLTHVEEGTVLAVGGYLLTCISTPGHTPGHMCLYEPKHKFLIAGDHILADITSNITAWLNFHDSLGQYLKSLNKIDLMEIDMVLPGHRERISDCHERIAELKSHHQNRLAEALVILRQGPMTGYQVASRMHWDMPHDDWEQVPYFQKWFATGEAVAHLEHLAEQGLVQRIQQDEKLDYALV